MCSRLPFAQPIRIRRGKRAPDRTPTRQVAVAISALDYERIRAAAEAEGVSFAAALRGVVRAGLATS